MTPTSRQLRRIHISYVSLLSCAGLLSLALSSDIRAGIVSSSGLTVLAAPPAGNVHAGTQEPTASPIIFPEVLGGVVGKNGVGAGGLRVDHNGSPANFTPALSGGPIVNPLMLDATIPANTAFDSYLIHFDPSSNGGNYGFSPAVNVEFSQKIIGVQLFSKFAALQKPAGTPYTGTLEDGDAVIAANGGPAVNYYPPATELARGLDEDQISISPGSFKLWLQGVAFGAEIDQVRVLVAVPEPTGVMLAFAGLLGMSFLGITRVGRACRS